VKFDIGVNFDTLSTSFKFHENLKKIMCTLNEDICTFMTRDLGTNFPPIIVINSQPPIQEHCVIGWSGLQQEISVLLYIAPSACDRDS